MTTFMFLENQSTALQILLITPEKFTPVRHLELQHKLDLDEQTKHNIRTLEMYQVIDFV